MAGTPERWPRAEWSAVERPGTRGVDGRVLLHLEGRLLIAQLRFAPRSTIDEHDAPHEIDVLCLEGSGFASVDGERHRIAAGEQVRWPGGSMHRLWTEEGEMVALMVEHLGWAAGG